MDGAREAPYCWGMPATILVRSPRSVRVALLFALALTTQACQDPAAPVLQIEEVAGEYALVTISGVAVPTGFAGTRMSQFRTIEGALTLRADGTFLITETGESRYQDSGNPFDPEPHYSTYKTSGTGTFTIVGDSLHFSQPNANTPLWKAHVAGDMVHTDNGGRTYAREPAGT